MAGTPCIEFDQPPLNVVMPGSDPRRIERRACQLHLPAEVGRGVARTLQPFSVAAGVFGGGGVHARWTIYGRLPEPLGLHGASCVRPGVERVGAVLIGRKAFRLHPAQRRRCRALAAECALVTARIKYSRGRRFPVGLHHSIATASCASDGSCCAEDLGLMRLVCLPRASDGNLHFEPITILAGHRRTTRAGTRTGDR